MFKSKIPYKLIERYTDAVAVHGVGSREALDVRAENRGNSRFEAFADTIDRVAQVTIDRAADKAIATRARPADNRVRAKPLVPRPVSPAPARTTQVLAAASCEPAQTEVAVATPAVAVAER